MKVVRRVDESGLFVEDVLIADDETVPPDCVEEGPPEGVRRARWDGAAWRETVSVPDLLSALRENKKAELSRALVDSLNGAFQPGVEEREMLLVLAVTVARIAKALGIADVDPRLDRVVREGEHLLAKHAEVDAVRDDDPDAEDKIGRISL